MDSAFIVPHRIRIGAMSLILIDLLGLCPANFSYKQNNFHVHCTHS